MHGVWMTTHPQLPSARPSSRHVAAAVLPPLYAPPSRAVKDGLVRIWQRGPVSYPSCGHPAPACPPVPPQCAVCFTAPRPWLLPGPQALLSILSESPSALGDMSEGVVLNVNFPAGGDPWCCRVAVPAPDRRRTLPQPLQAEIDCSQDGVLAPGSGRRCICCGCCCFGYVLGGRPQLRHAGRPQGTCLR
jgi:hypothetical protein